MPLVLHYAPGSTATIPHAVIEESGLAFSLRSLDSDNGPRERESENALELTNRIPALEDGSMVVFETGAIVLHLLTKPEAAHLMPTYGSRDYTRFLQWLFYMTTSPKMAILEFAHPEKWTRDSQAQKLLKEAAQAKLATQCDFLDANVYADTFLSSGFSALDIYLTELARWSRGFAVPMWKWSRLERVITATRQRPAFQRMLTAHGLTWPTEPPPPMTWREKVEKYWA
tara:strand:+ start:5590 stop:6273 length:684 start_codon:yes stop_codon:yes gene_type:complete